MSIFASYFFFKSILSHKNWRGGGELLLKVNWYNQWLLKRRITDHLFAQAGFTLRGVPGTVSFGKFGRGSWITFNKMLDKCLK